MYVGERNVRETRRLQAYSFLVRLMYIVHTEQRVEVYVVYVALWNIEAKVKERYQEKYWARK